MDEARYNMRKSRRQTMTEHPQVSAPVFVRPPDDIDSMTDEELDAWCRAVIMTLVEKDED